MDWLKQLFVFCERGADTSLWAEPLNAVTSSLFVLVGIWLWIVVRTQGLVYQRPTIQYILALLVILMGTANFGLHTQGTHVDFLLILGSTFAFSLLYLYLVQVRFLRFKPKAALISISIFGTAWLALTLIPCLMKQCLNPTFLYVPTVLVLVVITQRLHQRNHPATRWLGGGSILLGIGLLFHGIDQPYCTATLMDTGYYWGWHYLWHIFSGVAVFVLVQALIQFYRYSAVGET